MSTGLNSVGSSNGFPYQKRTYKEKNDKFFKECIDAGVSMANWNINVTSGSGVRTSKKNKIINYNLYNDKVDAKEMEKTMNPFGINVSEFPASYRNYPLLNPSINLLCGEERKRLFNPLVTTLNSDAVTQKLQEVNDEFAARYVGMLQQNIQDEEVIKAKLQEFSKWKYTYKDRRERMGNQVLNYLYNTQDLKEEFSRGFKDALIAGEEIYVIEIFGGEPRLRKANPLNIYTLRSGESWKIEDSDIIIEDVYMPIGEVIDRYYDELTSTDIKKLEEGFKITAGTGNNLYRDQLINQPIDGAYLFDLGDGSEDGVISNFKSYFGGAFDSEGNVRVTRVVWAGLRQIKVLTYIDEMGQLQKEVLPEQYNPKTDLGDQIKSLWIKEWYEGTRIAEDLYVKKGPCAVQMRHRDNLSISSPGIVGTVYATNSSKARSLMDIGRDYQYLWNTFWYRTELAFAKYKGKIGKLPLHLIPDFQDVNSALYFAEFTGWMLQDKFNESNRGVSKGKLAGAMNEGSDVIDLEMGNYIQHHINMLTFIKQQVDELTGITPQRRGAIDNRETVGGVERSVMQSSHITEEWFSIHDNTRVRALRALLEAAKIAWEGQSFTKEYVLDDGTKGILEFDAESFAEATYGVDVSNASNDMQTLQAMRNLGERIAQIDGGLKVVSELYRTKDIASLHRKIEAFEDERAAIQQEQFQAEQEAQQAQIQAMQEMEIMKIQIEQEEKALDREFDAWKTEQDNITKITIAEISAYKFAENMDQNNNGIPDPMEISAAAREDRALDADIFTRQLEQQRKEKEVENKKQAEAKKAQLEEKKLALEEKKLEAAKELQKQKDKEAYKREVLKGKIAIKNKVSGEK